MEQIDDLGFDLPLPEFTDWAEVDEILELGSAGTTPRSSPSPSHYSSGSHCSSPFSNGGEDSGFCGLDSPDPLLPGQQLFCNPTTINEAAIINQNDNVLSSSQQGHEDYDDEDRLSVVRGGSDSLKKKSLKTRRTRKTTTQRSGETKHKRNERERRRVKKLSDAFISLRDSVPSCIGDKKLSKLETLNYALCYMHNLSSMLYQDDVRKRTVQTDQWLAAANAMNQQGDSTKSMTTFNNQINFRPQSFIVDPTYAGPVFLLPTASNDTNLQNGWLNFVNTIAVPVQQTASQS
eukprot:gene12847-14169_t